LSTMEAIHASAHGDKAEAAKAATEALSHSGAKDVRGFAAMTFARIGDAARAQKLIDDLHREFPSDTALNAIWIPTIGGAIALGKNQPAEAVAKLEQARKYEASFLAAYFSLFVRGDAYLRMHDGAKAAAEFQKIVDHRSVRSDSELIPMSQLNLARAYEMQGDHAKARTAYQDVMAVWKDADPDFLPMKEARAEYAKLQ